MQLRWPQIVRRRRCRSTNFPRENGPFNSDDRSLLEIGYLMKQSHVGADDDGEAVRKGRQFRESGLGEPKSGMVERVWLLINS